MHSRNSTFCAQVSWWCYSILQECGSCMIGGSLQSIREGLWLEGWHLIRWWDRSQSCLHPGDIFGNNWYSTDQIRRLCRRSKCLWNRIHSRQCCWSRSLHRTTDFRVDNPGYLLLQMLDETFPRRREASTSSAETCLIWFACRGGLILCPSTQRKGDETPARNSERSIQMSLV